MASDSSDQEQWVPVGKISGLFGVKGWIKVYSNTQPRENILSYSPWFLQREGHWQEYELVSGQAHGKGVIAQLSGCQDRDMAAELIGTEIAIKRSQLPAAGPGEYYWSDLKGLTVVNLQSIELGKVISLMETGANDVLIVHAVEAKGKAKRERLIPYVVEQIIQDVNLDTKTITVDWDADF